MSNTHKIVVTQDDLSDGNIIRLLQEHREEMLKHSPPENVHALDVSQLTATNITFWSAWLRNGDVNEFAGCGALKDLGERHGELKSMKTRPQFLRKGVAQALLNHILQRAEVLGFERISLETGTQAVFQPAHALYMRNGFENCEPFGDYESASVSVCMTKVL